MFRYRLLLLCLQSFLVISAAIKVKINTSRPIFKVSERFVSVTLDQSELHKKPPFGPLDFSLPRVQNLLKGLSPGILRFGGTTTDTVVFTDIPQTIFDSADITPPITVITVKEFDELAKVCYDNGLRLLFEFNIELRYGQQWDPTNALSLLTYISKQPYVHNMDFELGNEPNDFHKHEGWLAFNGTEISRDYRIMKRLLRHLNFKSASIVGPDTRPCVLFGEFVQDAAKHITAATIHHYYFKGPTANASSYIDPSHFPFYEKTIKRAQKFISASPRPDLPLWNGETSDAFGSGTKNVSDRYVSGFLWLDKLGVSAKMQVGVVMRQAFYGGHYSLVNDSMYPNPDYWLSYVHKQLVGQLVFHTRLKEDTLYWNESAPSVRGYTHCSRSIKGGLVFYGLNVKAKDVTLKFDPSLGTEVDVYWLTPGEGGLLSKTVLLNGKPLTLQNEELPPLTPKRVDITDGFTIPSRTFGFIVFPSANVPLCV